MTDFLSLPTTIARQTGDIAQSLAVLTRRGMLNPLRPDEGLRSIRIANRYGPFVAVMDRGLQLRPGAAAIIDERGALTFAELDTLSNAYARGLRELGVQPGSVVATLCRDHRGMVLSMLAAGKLGVRLVLMNTGFAKPQFAAVAEREQVRAVLHDSEFLDLLDAVPASIPRVLTWVDEKDDADPTLTTVDTLIAEHSSAPLPTPAQPGGMVILTSGTTGTPKGAPRDKVSPLAAAQFIDRVPITRDGTMVMAAPIFHGTGLSQFSVGVGLGNTVVFQQRRFNPEATLANIAKYRATTLVVVPTMLQRIIDLDPEILRRYDTSSLQVIFAAGSAVSPDLSRRTARQFGNVLYNLYGSTEVAVAAVATPEDMRRAPGTVGRPPVGCRVAIYDAERNKITEPGEVGTIFVSSGLSFGGYTDGRHKEIVDGMLSSGDVGHFDEQGYLFVDGRDDDMIVSGGENVFPLEVENLLAERSDVHDAAVVGVEDADFGKRLRAFVVPGPNSNQDAQELKDYVKANLARFKVPRDVVFVDELPRNATGKVLRRQLETMDI
ncbi:acyl-CoA synthetase [Skermania piniformis]|uniref:Acyl-CoA synthetase n=1 Tax=Skermania pinensis TaxID=39122 RepID=A0ABX8SGV7_9ACTN|nr:acyl-CoA synthetase [Skermania piniformis]QXQ14911.1 acyl-CoA synthetase [Skermania piniformis]